MLGIEPRTLYMQGKHSSADHTLSPYYSLLWKVTSSPELTSHSTLPISLLCHKTLLPRGRLWGGVRNHLSSYRQCWSMGGLNKSMLIKYMKQREELTIKFKKDTWHYGSNLVYTRLHKRKHLWGKGRGEVTTSPVQPQKSPSSCPWEHIFRVGVWSGERGPGFKLQLCKK